MTDWRIPNLGDYMGLEITYMPPSGEPDDEWDCSFLTIRTVLDSFFGAKVGASVDVFVETSIGLSGAAMPLNVSMEYNSHLILDW